LSPSAHAGSRCAVRTGHGSGRSRFGVSHRCSTRASADRSEQTMSPVRFSALRTRCGEARHADDSLAVPHFRRAAWMRRLNVLAKRSCQWSLVQGSIGETDSIRSEATRHIKRHRFAHSPLAAGHASPHAFARCSATGSSLRGLADPSGPSLCSGRRRSWGSGALRRFAPATGDRAFLSGRAHVPVRPVARPD